MFTTPEPTAEISPDQGWELIWEELKRVGIAPGRRGPFEGGVLWGENANQAIQALRELNLRIPAICSVGLLVQAAIRAAEVRFQKGSDCQCVESKQTVNSPSRAITE